MQDYSTITVERDGAVDWLTLNRPDALNSVTGTMVHELWSYLSALETDYGRRIVVLRGAGRCFSAGADMKSWLSGADPMPHGYTSSGSIDADLADVIRLFRRIPQPVIAALHGPVCGAAFAFALASDIRIAGASMRASNAFIRLGVSGCELGVSYFLPRIVGLTMASEIMLTGRFVEAEEAQRIGLVSRIVPDDKLTDAVRDITRDMLLASPMGLRKTKSTLNLAQRLNDVDAVINLEEHAQMKCMEGGVFKEAVQAFVEKRSPKPGPQV